MKASICSAIRLKKELEKLEKSKHEKKGRARRRTGTHENK
jgi:hypothetical protein